MGNPTTPRDGLHQKSDKTSVPEHDNRDARTEAEAVLPLVEEAATIEKREVVTGTVRVRTVTETLEELAQANLQSESVEVTRVPVDRVVAVAPAVRTENDVVIVPVLEEVLVVQNQLVLKEELHIRRRIETEAVAVPIRLRKQRAIVEREAPDGSISNTETTDP